MEAPEPSERPEHQVGLSLRAIGTSTAVLAVASLLAQVFTLGRELFVASQVGTSGDLDSLLVAVVAPTILSGLIVSGATVAIVPARAAVLEREGAIASRRFVGGIFTWMAIIAVAVTVLILAFPGLWVAIAGPGLDESGRSEALGFIPIVAPIAIFAVLSSLLSTLCQMEGRFRAIALAWLVGPVVSLVVTVGLWQAVGLAAFGLAMTANLAATTVVLLVYAAAVGILPVPTLRLERSESRRFLGHAAPLTVSGLVNQLRLVTDRAVASFLPTGAISSLRYGETLVLAPTQAIAPGWTLVVYPALVGAATSSGGRSLGADVQLAVRYVVALFTPLAIATMAFAPLIVRPVYQRGAFDDQAAASVTAVVAALGPMFVLTMIQGVLVPAHNARRRGTFLLAMGIVGAALNLALNLALGIALGVGGVALSTSLTLAIVLLAMAHRLSVDEPGFEIRPLLHVGARATVAAAIPALPLAAIAYGRPAGDALADLILLAILTAVGAVAYVALATFIGVREPSVVVTTGWRTIAGRLRRPARLGPP
jgi:putative peptidoglycan lipid II flippase